MEELIADFSLDYERFVNILDNDGILLAGSAGLWGYMKKHQIDTNFVPNDIDIWISQNAKTQFTNLIEFLKESGYKETHDSNKYYKGFCLKHLLKFVNEQGKQIQVITVKSEDLKQYISYEFDINICMSFWDNNSQQFASVWPEDIKERSFFIVNHKPQTPARITKYIERGFSFHENNYCDDCGGECDGVHGNTKVIKNDIAEMVETIMSYGKEKAGKVLDELTEKLSHA